MAKVLVHGSYFSNNFGDTLLVKLMCDYVSSIVGRENVRLAVSGDVEEQKDIGFEVIFEDEMSSVTHIIYAGGGYFGEPRGGYIKKIKWSIRNYNRHLSWLPLYRGASIAFFGVGFGPLSNSIFRRNVLKLLDKSNFVYLRDVESKMYLESYRGGIVSNVCVDMALSLKRGDKAAREKKIALHIGELSTEEIAKVCLSLKEIFFSEDNEFSLEVIFDNKKARSDKVLRNYRDAITSVFGNHDVVFREYLGFSELVDRLNKYSLVITSKLHVGIVSIALGGKVVSIPNHQKTYRLYKQLSLTKFCIDRKRLLHSDDFCDALYCLGEFRPDYKVIDDGVARLYAGINSFVEGVAK